MSVLSKFLDERGAVEVCILPRGPGLVLALWPPLRQELQGALLLQVAHPAELGAALQRVASHGQDQRGVLHLEPIESSVLLFMCTRSPYYLPWP